MNREQAFEACANLARVLRALGVECEPVMGLLAGTSPHRDARKITITITRLADANAIADMLTVGGGL